MFGNKLQAILPTPLNTSKPKPEPELKQRCLFYIFSCKFVFYKVKDKKVNPIIDFTPNEIMQMRLPQQPCSLVLHSVSIKKEKNNKEKNNKEKNNSKKNNSKEKKSIISNNISAVKRFSDCSLNNCDNLMSSHSNDDNQSDYIKSLIIPDVRKSPTPTPPPLQKIPTAKVSVENSPTFSFSIANNRLFASKYPMFHMKNVEITRKDYIDIKNSWQLVTDEKLYYFKNMKLHNIVSDKKTGFEWFCDVFYETVYTYDMINSTVMTKVFKYDLKLQDHVLRIIINNCINFAHNYKILQSFDYSIMFQAHEKFGITYKYYVIIMETLLATFDRCLRLQWTREMEFAWCKTISLILRGILPYYGGGGGAPAASLD